jgi:hypothetical protein
LARNRPSPRCSGGSRRRAASAALDPRGADAELANKWTDDLLFALSGPIYAGTNNSAKHHRRAAAGSAQGRLSGEVNRDRRAATRLRRQHRRGSGPQACRGGARVVRGRHRAWPQGVGRAGDLGVTALAVAERFEGIGPIRSTWWSRPNGWVLGCARSRRRVHRRRTGAAGQPYRGC